MKTELKTILEKVRDGSVSVDDAILALKKEPFEDIGYAKIDLHRNIRQGMPEVIYGAGKTPEQIIGIIEKMKQKENGTYEILAAIYCEKQSHKGIIIGKGGEKLKQIGSLSRRDIERFLGAKVYLELWVRVKEDWRNRENFITDIGFE